MLKYKITVFTPTYNRSYIIKKLYDSLSAQTFRNFEWVVVDDGSTDDTQRLFQQWINEGKISIRYIYKNNGGKHRAINEGLKAANGDIFVPVDSDDQLTNDALEKINIWFNDIKNEKMIVGIVANRGYTPTQTVNSFFAESYLDKPLNEMKSYTEDNKYVLGGERLIAFYTEVHRTYPFPSFDGENFMTEAVVYNRIAHDGKMMRFYNDIICLSEYHDDGLTKQGDAIYKNNPLGYGLWIKEELMFDNTSLFHRISAYYKFTCDLCQLYSVEFIAKCLNLATWKIKLLHKVHVIKQKLSK